MPFAIKRVYDEPAGGDGVRILVDRLWPRGIKKEAAKVDRWMKEIAPSTELRKWIHANPSRWDEFRKRYTRELADRSDLVDEILDLTRAGNVTLLYSAKNTERNNAVALMEYLDGLGGG